jgi:heptosyltransferase-3
MSTSSEPVLAGGASQHSLPLAQQDWFDRLARRAPSILIVQRDNIGDLVLVTPFLEALRTCIRDARIDILVNSYNAATIEGSPDIDHSYQYLKAKHREPKQSLLSVYWNTWRLWRTLRRNHYDLVVLMTGRFAATSLRPALAAHAPHIAGFVDGSRAARRIDLGIAPESVRERHVVRRSEALLDTIVPASLRQRFWPGELPSCRVFPDPNRVERIRRECDMALGYRGRRIIGVHVSARKIDQRLSVQKFVTLMHQLHAKTDYGLMLFWAPGGSANALHPGDDAKVEEIIALTTGLPVFAHETRELSELMAGLSVPQLLVCSDGGAMHLAAAQQVPIVALFGNSEPDVWHPWGSRHEVLHAPSHRVEDLSVEEILEAALRVLRHAAGPPVAGVQHV